MKNIIEALNWRYAVKQFDPNKKLSTEQINTLLEALRLAPSSIGLQPWKFIVVENPGVRAELREAGYGQSKITEASHLIVIAVQKKLDDAYVDRFIRATAEAQGLGVESLKGLRDMAEGALRSRTPEAQVEWSTRQAYLALGVLVATAAHEGIDACPMEGFDPKKFDEILGLEKMGLVSEVAVAVGFRSPDDKYASTKKVRFPKEEVVMNVR